jgi:hypothetical protein
VLAVVVVQVQQVKQAKVLKAETAVQVQPRALLVHRLHALAVVVAELTTVLAVPVELVVAVMVKHSVQQLQHKMEQLTRAAVAVVTATQPIQVQAVQA